MKTIDITPLGYKVPGGSERIAKASEELDSARATVASKTQYVLHQHLDIITYALRYLVGLTDEDAADIIAELRKLDYFVAEMTNCQEEFLRAVAGASPK
jgi:hypothetical protein